MASNARNRVFYLILVMAIVGFVVAGAAIAMLYQAAFEEERARLIETAQSRARLIEAVARFDALYNRDYPEGAEAATISQITEAHKNFKGFGETGEFTMARLVEGQMVFLLSHRHHDLEKPKPVPFDSTIAEPMRQALSGQSGSLVGLDYRGETVLAAYEPVAVLKLGIVAKIDISEIRASFVRASFAAGGVAIAVIILGSILFLRISDPMIRRLKEYSENLENEVEERTRDLEEANETLKIENAERERAEEELKNERDYLEKLHNSLGEAVFSVRMPERVIEFANQTVETIFGYRPEECMGQETRIFYPEGGSEAFISKMKAVIYHGEDLLRTEQNLKRKDGEIFPAEITTTFLREEGEVTRVISIVQDITERKRAEGEMRKLLTAIEHSANMILITDVNGVIEYVNPKFTETTGYTKEEALGANPRILASKETPKEVHKELWDTILSGEVWRGIYRNQKKNGEGYLASTVITPVMDESGDITHFLAVQEDVTERQKMERELEKSQRLESLGVLAGGIAHDFNNILTGILANISFANDLSTSDKVRSRLEEAEKASFMAKGLTQQLLTFSKGGEPIKRAIAPGKLVRESTEFALRGSKTACDFEISDEISVIEADKGQIDQVIQNLVINADQAMPEGGVITVKTDDVVVGAGSDIPLKAGKYVRISVIDHGIGIPGDIISKIFDPFYTTKSTGSGFGLASAYSIITKHNGHIAVASENGEGATFDIYLPVSKLCVPATDAPKDGVMRGTGRVLVMDDEDVVREVVVEILTNLGYDVESVKDGSEAIEAYREAKEKDNPFDLVIMDLTIPGGMGGEKAIGELIKIDPEVAAVVSSGYSNAPVMSDLKARGFKAGIVKPFSVQELSRVIQDLLTKD